jgi:hypothetical protein
MPATLELNKNRILGRPKASISYRVVASFKTSLVMRPYEFGRQLVVMEQPIPFEQYKFLTNEISLKGYLC